MDEDRFDKVVKYFMRHRGHLGGIASAVLLVWYTYDKFHSNTHGEFILALTTVSGTILGAGGFKSDDYQKVKQAND